MNRWFLYFGVVGLLFSAQSRVAQAHEGHAHKVMGTVATVHESHLEVKDKDGKLSAHVLDSRTKIRRGKVIAKMTDLKVGDRVVVTTIETKDKAGTVVKTVTHVDIGAAVAVTTTTKQ